MSRQLILVAVLFVLGTTVEKAFADEPDSIVGGTDAEVGEFPHQVSLQILGDHYCGGSLITNKHILTAAHCVDDFQSIISTITVMTGTNSLEKGGQSHKVKRFIIHEGYVSENVRIVVNDIAVIELEAPIVPNAYQQPISIGNYPAEMSVAYITGWGQLSAGGDIPTILKKARVYVLSNEECQRRVGKSDKIASTNICVLYRPGIGACSGDSGGPLTYEGELVGVASMAYPCALGKPDIYVRPSDYMDFISKAIQ